MTQRDSGKAYIKNLDQNEPFGSKVGRKWVGSDSREVPLIMLGTTPNDPI